MPRGNCRHAGEVSGSFQVGCHEVGSFAGHYGASMTVEHKLITGEAFDQFLATHPDGLYELIHGEIVEKVPTEEHAKIAGIILGELYLYLKQHPEIKAHLGPEVRYRPEGDLYNDRIPDVAV